MADSLAGRMLTLTLWPLTAAETTSRGPSMVLDWAVSKDPDLKDLPAPESATRADYIGRVLKGGFPEIRNLDHTRRQRVYREYVDAMVDRDVADIVRIRKGDALRRLIDQSGFSQDKSNLRSARTPISKERQLLKKVFDRPILQT